MTSFQSRHRHRSRVRLARCIAALVGAAALGGCTPPPSVESYPVSLAIQGDPGRPLAGAEVVHDARVVGVSDAEGSVSLEVRGTEGQILVVHVLCPDGHRSPLEPISIVLHRISERDRNPEYAARCEPLLRTLVVAVRAENGPNLPLYHLGREVARTDRAGAAHFMLKSAPEDDVELTLDTSQAPTLRPQHPSTRFRVAGQDDVLVFSQKFELPPKPKRAIRRAMGIVRLGAR